MKEVPIEEVGTIWCKTNRFDRQRKQDNILGHIEIEEGISEFLQKMESRDEVLILAEGLRAVSARAVPHGMGTVSAQWRTDFYPGARYRGQEGCFMPLGFHERYDLYLGFQWPLLPTLIARFGNQPQEHESFSTFMLGCLGIPEHFFVAHQRALRAGIPLDGGNERSTAFFVHRPPVLAKVIDFESEGKKIQKK
jgi:hypothetical protein